MWRSSSSYYLPPDMGTWGSAHSPGRVGYDFVPQDPFIKAKALRKTAEMKDGGATFTRDKAVQTRAAGDIKIALEANGDASAAWTSVRIETSAGQAAAQKYAEGLNPDPNLIVKWKTEGDLLAKVADLRIQFLGTDRETLLALHAAPDLNLDFGRLAPAPPPEAPPPEWVGIAENAAIVAVVSAIVYTGWKILTKGAL